MTNMYMKVVTNVVETQTHESVGEPAFNGFLCQGCELQLYKKTCKVSLGLVNSDSQEIDITSRRHWRVLLGGLR